MTAAPMFPNPVYRVGSNPYGMGMADFNRDGIQDLVVANFGPGYDGNPGDLSLLLGRGDGTFAEEVRIPTSQHAADVSAADFNRDGIGDLVVTYPSSSTAYFLPGLGDGTFGPESLVATSVYALRLADFNHDGLPDLLVDGASATSYFQALLGRGDGTFAAAPAVSPGDSFGPIAVDVNGDGFDDVLTNTFGEGYTPNSILVYLGTGNGSFVLAGSFATGEYSDLLLPADLDGDGHIDLGVDTIHADDPHSGTTGPFILYFGNGDGTFVRGPSVDQYLAMALIASDLNGDGIQDYVRIGYFDDVTPILGAGNRTYTEQPLFYTGIDVTRAVAGDFGRDGRLDLAILGNMSEAVFLYEGNGDGTFGPPINPTIRDSFLGGLVTDDFNGDGVLDIAAALLDQDAVAFLPGDGAGSFGAETRSPAGVGPLFLASVDMNGDGRKDLVVSDRNWHFSPPMVSTPASVAILLGNGDGTFQTPLSFTAPESPLAMHVADFDGDGHADVLVANGYEGIQEPDLSLFLGNGDGTLRPEIRLSAGAVNIFPYGWTAPMGLASGDLDGDGRRDIVVAMSGLDTPGGAGAVRVFHGQGGGLFGPPITVADTVSSAGVTVADLDGDGAGEIVVADAASYTSINPGGLYVLHNDGASNFTASRLLEAGIGPFDVQVADMTLDGVSDLVASNNAGYMAILPGLGGLAYGAPIRVGLFGMPLAMVKGDFTGDGTPDMLIASGSGMFIVQVPANPALAIDAAVSTKSPLGKGSGTVTWTTNAEFDLAGFNILEETAQGTRRINPAMIPCTECITGRGSTYTSILPKHKSGKNVFIQAVHIDGRLEVFGPARKE
jgi:hypothetical protein